MAVNEPDKGKQAATSGGAPSDAEQAKAAEAKAAQEAADKAAAAEAARAAAEKAAGESAAPTPEVPSSLTPALDAALDGDGDDVQRDVVSTVTTKRVSSVVTGGNDDPYAQALADAASRDANTINLDNLEG